LLTRDTYWEIWQLIKDGTSVGDLTTAVEAIALAEKTVSENYFSNVVDQVSFSSADYVRLRSFLRDWYATHRTITTQSVSLSDPYGMPNNELDILFQSFGYDLSAILKNPIGNEPLLAKVNFFLDLVNLYHIKGTPQALVDVLQYYGINQLDIYEFFLQLEDRPGKGIGDLVFKGDIVAGTSNDTSNIYLPYHFLTDSDPHWLYTESQIIQLNQTLDINLPSKTPYFAIKPIFTETELYAGASIISRIIQDQYEDWQATGIKPPKNASSSLTGDIVSILALYLACIYFFDKLFTVGFYGDNFFCYDGTSTSTIEILNEFETITSRPFTRADQRQRIFEFYDLFTRVDSQNFLQLRTDAKNVLAILNPTFKATLDSLTEPDLIVLQSLLLDVGAWIRSNISPVFMNLSHLIFGIDSVFSQLKDVINFFKPYRARLIPLETLEFRNPLFETIIVEDILGKITVESQIHDFITGDSTPCCTEEDIDSTSSTTICLDGTADLFYSRETYDCGSYFDIGAVTDIRQEVFIEDYNTIQDTLTCIPGIDASTTIVIDSTTSTYVTPDDLVADGTLYISADYISNELDNIDVLNGDSTASFDTTATIEVWQTGGFANYDAGGTFDCTTNFDHVQIFLDYIPGYLLTEEGGFLQLESGAQIIL